MEPIEIYQQLTALRQEIGGKAYVSARVDSDDGLAHGSLYPSGIIERPNFHVQGKTFAEVLGALRSEWAGYCAKHESETIKKMALAIIRITADRGRCADGDLRAEGFDASVVSRWGARACEMADEMASNGPFSIITIPNANAA